MSDIDTKLSAARARLILDKPFLGALALRLPLTQASPKWCFTTATDARRFFYNRSYIKVLSLEQTQFVIAHEALHCALSHFARRQYRNKKRWDLACDFAINPLLIHDGLEAPPNSLYKEEYEGMTAEEIYPLIDGDTDQRPQDQHLYDDENQQLKQRLGSPDDQNLVDKNKCDIGSGGDPDGVPQPPPLEPIERERLATQWQQRLAGAAQQAMRTGRLSGLIARMVDHLLQPQLPWRMLLARYMALHGREDFTYSRPSRREGEAILPSLRSAQIDIIVGLDISGSISELEMDQFISELGAIKGQMRARITLLPCDVVIPPESPWIFEVWDALILPVSIQGGGGTSFVPVFAWVTNNNVRPDLLVYFTDAKGTFPEQEPAYPVLWVVKGKAKVPWGQRIQLN